RNNDLTKKGINVPRVYLSYVNNGKQGLTWSALVAGALMLKGDTMSPYEISCSIWGKKDPPLQLLQLVQACVYKMTERSFVTRIQRGLYAITLLGVKVFQAHLDEAISSGHLRRYSDSKLF